MSDIPLPGIEGAPPARRRGRPPGASNKRSTDLLRYIEAVYGGLTPAQQMAELGLVKPAELRKVAKEARARNLPPVVVAMAHKAKELGLVLSCSAAEAWELMRKERVELMPYVHQKRPQAVQIEAEGAGLAVLMVTDRAPEPARQVLEGDWREAEENQGLNQMVPLQVSQLKSHADE